MAFRRSAAVCPHRGLRRPQLLRLPGPDDRSVSDRAIAGGETGVDHHFRLSWIPGVTVCLPDLVLVVQYPDEMAFVAHLQLRRLGSLPRSVPVATSMRALTNWFGNRASSGLLKRAFSLMVPVVSVNLVIRAEQRPSLIFCLLVRSQAPPPAFSRLSAPGPDGRDRRLSGSVKTKSIGWVCG